MNRMNVILTFLLLLLPLCLVNGAESETFCSAMNGETLRYTVRSRKNETSHRVVSDIKGNISGPTGNIFETDEDPRKVATYKRWILDIFKPNLSQKFINILLIEPRATTIYQVDLQKDSVRNKEKNSTTGDVDLDVAHTYLQCSGKERIILSTVASTTELKSPALREDYELFPGLGFYKLHTNAEDWETARSTCVREGGHLIVINSDAEAEVVKIFFSRKPEFAGASEKHVIFVGVHDYLKEGQYMALTGEQLDETGYSRWASGEPNGGSEHDYIVADKDGFLYDAPNTNKYGFICEQ